MLTSLPLILVAWLTLFLPHSLIAAVHTVETGDYRIEPLMESAGITIFSQVENTQTQVQFRAFGEYNWQEGNSLYFDPTTDSLSGALVHLQPNTEYEVRIVLDSPASGWQEFDLTFMTRPDTPPIDPGKVYYLSDIYYGGTLDLEALGIEGEEDGWAKIVGDVNTPIIADDGAGSAVSIGDNSYVYFENILIKKGGVQGFHAVDAHHIWINGCDISSWGRVARYELNGIAVDDDEETINYDSAFYLKRSGVITIENCYVHDPVLGANNWDSGHPKGANAFIAYANHPNPEFEGQIVIRNNIFTGSDSKRFNDVIESRFNGEVYGGFIRDSAIYNNVFAYANDDLIEMDGGQQNVLVYNNDLSHGYAGVSAVPNMRGPSYIFNNTIHHMGDDTGKMWASIKVGGLYARPEGLVNVFNNFINVYRNGITASDFEGDNAFWVNAVNNIIITELANNAVGYGIYDPQKSKSSQFVNNYLFNLKTLKPRNDAAITQGFAYPELLNLEFARSLMNQSAPKVLALESDLLIPNFSTIQAGELVVGMTQSTVGVKTAYLNKKLPFTLNMDDWGLNSYRNQNQDNLFTIQDNHSLTLTGNTWLKIGTMHPVITEHTVLDFTFFGEEGAEIAAIGFDNNNRLHGTDLMQLYGSQQFGMPVDGYQEGSYQQNLSIPLAQYFKPKRYEKMVFALDNDISQEDKKPSVTFSNIMLYDAIDLRTYSVESFTESQDDLENGRSRVSADGHALTVEGNVWKKITGNFAIDASSVLVLHVKIEGNPEIVGIGFDNDNAVMPEEVFSFGGTQEYGLVQARFTEEDGWQRLLIPVGEHLPSGNYQNLTFVVDNDVEPESGKVIFKNIALLNK